METATQCQSYNMYEKQTWYQAQLYTKDHNELPAGAAGEFRDFGTSWKKVTLRESGVHDQRTNDCIVNHEDETAGNDEHNAPNQSPFDAFDSDNTEDITCVTPMSSYRRSTPGRDEAFGVSKPLRRK